MASRSSVEGGWTVARLHALPEDGNTYEIIDGVLHVTPTARFLHQRAVYRLALLLETYATSRGFEVMPREGDIEYSDDTLVQPDAFAYRRIPGWPVQTWADVHPLQLVIEVLSPSTWRWDCNQKRRLYQSQRIPEYWIVNLDARVIERWRPDDTEPERLTTTLAWQPDASHAPLQIDLMAYFASVFE